MISKKARGIRMDMTADRELERVCNIDTEIDVTGIMLIVEIVERNGGCWSISIGEPLHSRGTVVQSG